MQAALTSSVRRCTCGEQLTGVLVVNTDEVSLRHSLSSSRSLVTDAEYLVLGNERLGVGKLLSSFVGEEQLEEKLDTPLLPLK